MVAVAAPGAHADGSGSRSEPRCFGAAARDQRKPCHNPRLRYVVRPRPSVAQITPNDPCDRLEPFGGGVHPCAFGVRPRRAVATVALIGDSHASHWRAAVDEAARVRRWYGISATNGVCPISETRRRWTTRGVRRGCDGWVRSVIRWLERNPQIRIVVQSQINNEKEVFTRAGQTQFEAKVSGYRRIWRRFPPSVRRIIVIRDVPTADVSTPSCVMRARARRRPPGPTCALARSSVLPRDPAAVAARRSRLRELRVADLSRYFCDRRLCYPVIGGALVHKDQNHITRVFSRTLGPYLLRRFDQVVPRPN